MTEIFEVNFKEISTSNDLFCQFDEHHGVLFLDVKRNFSKEDFQTIEELIDQYFYSNGDLRGVIINAPKFPYWKGAQNRKQYLEFVRNNHNKFRKVALNIDGFFTKIVARVANGRIDPEVKIFRYNQVEAAQKWILGSDVAGIH